ncbi:unnamed protein product [Ectocarpus sp. 4 AP-2014]
MQCWIQSASTAASRPMVHVARPLRPLETERPHTKGPAAESGGMVVPLLSPTMVFVVHLRTPGIRSTQAHQDHNKKSMSKNRPRSSKLCVKKLQTMHNKEA